MAHRLSCSTACGIFLDQGSNLCTLYCQADFLTSAPTGRSLNDIDFLKRPGQLSCRILPVPCVSDVMVPGCQVLPAVVKLGLEA